MESPALACSSERKYVSDVMGLPLSSIRFLSVKEFSREVVGTLAVVLERRKTGKYEQFLVPVCLQVYV
jgi:hypothetical protein